jgi:hypothetical protein
MRPPPQITGDSGAAQQSFLSDQSSKARVQQFHWQETEEESPHNTPAGQRIKFVIVVCVQTTRDLPQLADPKKRPSVATGNQEA